MLLYFLLPRLFFFKKKKKIDYDGKRRREKSPIRLEEENEDEFSEIDEVGEKKVDKNGRLLGG